MKRALVSCIFVALLAAPALAKEFTTVQEWDKCMGAAVRSPKARSIEKNAGIIGLEEYALERCGPRPTVKKADGKRALMRADCARLYEIAQTADTCEMFGGSLAENNFIKGLDYRIFHEDAFWVACKQMQDNRGFTRASFGKQICGE